MTRKQNDQERKLKVQALIDRMLYLNDTDYQEFIHKYERLVEQYIPNQVEVDGVKYFRATC
tara:strand:+ start:9380 stop:9562 length:183 start_codon:yes stop_codon:yes gene_type:complete